MVLSVICMVCGHCRAFMGEKVEIWSGVTDP